MVDKYQKLLIFDKKIDCCLEIRNMSKFTKNDRIYEMKDFFLYLNGQIDLLAQKSSDHKFT